MPKKSLSEGQQRFVFGALVVVLVAFGIYLSMGGFSDNDEGKKSDQAEDSNDKGGDGGKNPPSPIPTEDVNDADVVEWLPFDENEIKTAAATAQGFGEAYGTIDYSKSPKKYYSSMEELATKEYAKNLKESSGAGAMWQEMSKKEAVAEGHANVKSIRSFGKDSLVFVIKAQSITKDSDGAEEDLGDYAVTVVQKDDEWKVYDFQPAEAGNMGETQ